MTAVPAGFRLSPDRSLRRFADGRILLGGQPVRVLALTDAGARQAQELLRGDPVTQRTGVLARRLLDAGLAHPSPPATAAIPSATVVIPVRDRPRELDRCLRALGDAHPVVVVDDGSRDPAALAEVCAARGAELVSLRQNRGPSAARNAATARVDTELIAFLDSDTVPPPDWPDQLTGHFADRAVGAVAPRIRPLPALAGSLRQRYADARSPLDLGARPGGVTPNGRVAYVPSAALVVRAAAFDDAAFDPDLRCAEDVDLVWRLHDAGWRVRYDPSVVVHHDEPATWPAFLGRHHRYGTAAAPLAVRHPGRAVHIVIAPLPTAAAGLLLSRRPRSAAILISIQLLMLTRGLVAVGIPAGAGVAISATWIARTLAGLSRSATMFAAPLLGAALLHGRMRAGGSLLLLASPLADSVGGRPRVDAPVLLALRLVDEFAYGTGVVAGCIRERTLEPLRPRLVWGFGGRRQATSTAAGEGSGIGSVAGSAAGAV